MKQTTPKSKKFKIDSQGFSEVGFQQASICRKDGTQLPCEHKQQFIEKLSDGYHWQLCCERDCNLKLFVR